MTYILATVVSVLFLLADRISKHIVVSEMALNQSVPFIPKFMDFTYIYNTGGAWGVLAGKTWILVVLTAAVMLGCIAYLIYLVAARKKEPLLFWAISLILSGGLGNMIDRVFNDGKVIDFFRTLFIEFPIFNVADCAVVIGSGLLILYCIRDIIKEIKDEKVKKAELKEQNDE